MTAMNLLAMFPNVNKWRFNGIKVSWLLMFCLTCCKAFPPFNHKSPVTTQTHFFPTIVFSVDPHTNSWPAKTTEWKQQ